MSDSALGRLYSLHAAIDQAAQKIAQQHGARLTCHRGCHDCCTDGITVSPVEAARIQANHEQLLAAASPHPEGKCAFLDDQGSCRIYSDRPYVCRTQGLPLRWLEFTGPDEGFEYRDICPLNEAGTPIEELDPGACWTLGPTEEELGRIQVAHQGHSDEPDRIELRSLFAQSGSE